MKAKLKFIIPIVIAVIAIIIAAVFIKFSPKESVDFSSLMSTAQKYLVEQNYEQAIAEFKKIIDLDPMNAGAYLGLADAYIGMDDTDSAVEWLKKGYEITGDERLKEMIDRLNGGNVEAEATTYVETTSTDVTTTEPQVEEFITIKGEQYSTLLTWIDLSSKELTDKDIKPLEKMVNLTILHLGNNQISDISALKGLTNLTDLQLASNQISDISVLSGLTNLTTLVLAYNQVSDISALSGLTDLTFLDLEFNQINDIIALSGLTNLTALHLEYNQISDISALSELTNLTNLNLNDNQIVDISALSELNNLKYLELNSNQISDISVLSVLTNLISLGLFNNQISDISALNGLTNLERLSLGGNRNISKSDIETLKQALPDCQISG